ncbi:MAG: FtsX-like permease family protein [Candidatus Lokiarchaeota archaeon]|nr:FtsX-like permease family protein [Candidatus Lokiarchaeota archaeon]MBD3243060.1 FtsX-like permease family protein [Chitinivibrionales bacterium]
MFQYVISNILRQKAKSVLLVVGISALVSMVICITGIVSYQLRNAELHSAVTAGRVVVQPQYTGTTFPPSTRELPEEEFEAVESAGEFQPHLSTPVLFHIVEPPEYPTGPPLQLLVGLRPGAIKAITGDAAHETKTIKGELALPSENHVVLGNRTFQRLKEENPDIGVGSTVELMGETFTVSGVLDVSNDQMVDFTYIIDLKKAQEIFDKPGFVSSFVLTLEDVSKLSETSDRINALGENYALITNETMAQNVEEGIKLFKSLVVTISTVVILVSTIMIMTVMLLSIRERTRDIGIFRALGMPNSRIIMLVFWEIFIIASLGCLIGGAVSSYVLKYQMLFDLFDFGHIVKVVPLALLLSVLSSIVPALRIVKINPIEALHYE